MTEIETYQPNRPSITEMAMLADRISKTGVVPSALRNKPDEVLATLMYGTELGLPPMQSLQLVDYLNGKPALNAQGQRALILAAGHEIWVEESSDEIAVLCGKRKGSERTHTARYALSDARAAGLVTKDNWKKNPKAMLVARATTMLARQAFADIVMGLGYDLEELAEFTPRSTEPAAIEATSQESPFVSAENAQALVDKCETLGLSVAEVVKLGTGGRTVDPAKVRVDEVRAVKDAMERLVPMNLTPAGDESSDGHVPESVAASAGVKS